MGAPGVRSIGELARFALEATSDAVYCLDPAMRFTYVSPNAARLMRREACDLVGNGLQDEFPGVVGTTIHAGLEQARATKQPEVVEDYYEPLAAWFEIRIFPDEEGVVVFFRDVSERRSHDLERARQADATAHRVRHDDLTGLPNRLLLLEHLEELGAGPSAGPVALLFIDIDGFKNVNDSLGHAVGDQLLRDLADRLRGSQRAQDLLARHGGDEFVVVAAPCTREEAEALAADVQQALADPFDVAGTPLPLSASIGIAVADPANLGAEELINDADTAMYAAKRDGKARSTVYSPELREWARRRLEVVGGLSDALRDDQLELHYQPVVHLDSGRVIGVEGLMRWRHPTLGLLSPAAFIPIAEETGIIVDMGRWALRAAAAQGAAWHAAGLDLLVGVNISAEHFPAGTLVDDVGMALDTAGLGAPHLVLELTETALAQDFHDAIDQLHQVRAAGARVAIDDFGAGYSSLGRLASFPVDFLKFDASLIRGSSDTREHATLRGIVQAVAGIAASIGVETLAEGIETEEQRVAAMELGCALGQGFGLARPMPATEVEACVRAAG